MFFLLTALQLLLLAQTMTTIIAPPSFFFVESFLLANTKHLTGKIGTRWKAAVNKELLFTEIAFEDIAEKVQERVRLPMVPDPVIKYTITRALQTMGKDLTPALAERIEEMMEAEETETLNDDLAAPELQLLADDIAGEFVGAIKVPILNTAQKLEILQQIFRVILTVLTTSDDERRHALFESTKSVAVDLFASTESRARLVERINAAVDIPIFGEAQESIIIQQAMDKCAAMLESILPRELISSLRGEPLHSVATFKDFLIQKVNEKVDLMGLTEAQEDALIRTMVDMLIEEYVDPTATETLLLTKEEQRTKYEEQVLAIEHEMQLSKLRFDREQAHLVDQLHAVQAKLRGM